MLFVGGGLWGDQFVLDVVFELVGGGYEEFGEDVGEGLFELWVEVCDGF